MSNRIKSVFAMLALILISGVPVFCANDQTVTFKIPTVKIPFKVEDQQVTIAASGLITLLREERGVSRLKLQLSADFSDLQQNMTEVLRSALDKDDHCGDRIAVQHATLTPLQPAALAAVQLHYERWACAKVFGKQEAKRLVGGNAVMQVKLTPSVSEDKTSLRSSRK